MITLEQAKRYFKYDDGNLIWVETTNSRAIKGSIAGNKKPDGYIRIGFKGSQYPAHKIVFLLFNGYAPKIIDHINRIKDDNRIENLRECTVAQNQWNIKARKNSKTGIKGVTWHKGCGKWQAQVQASGKRHFLGKFSNINDAKSAVSRFSQSVHGEFNCRG